MQHAGHISLPTISGTSTSENDHINEASPNNKQGFHGGTHFQIAAKRSFRFTSEVFICGELGNGLCLGSKTVLIIDGMRLN